jgi:two-component system response regulator VicR
MSLKILVVDDETAVTDLIGYNLRKAHYQVLTAHDGETALQLAFESVPDLVLLDLMIPKVDGLDVCRELRKTSDVPIIMITARGEEADRVIGLELGADDYVCKPFSMRELLARIKAVLRRNQSTSSETRESAILTGLYDLLLNEDSRTVSIGDNPLNLTRLEFDLMQYLLMNAGRVLSREQLLSQAWGYDFVGGTRAVDSAVKRLRAKIRKYLPEIEIIETVRGIGYRLIK